MDLKTFFRKYKIAMIILLLADFILCLTLWLNHEYAQIHLDEVLFQLKAPTEGMQPSLLGSAILWLIVLPLLLTLFLLFLYWRYASRKNLLAYAISFLIIVLFLLGLHVDAFHFMKNTVTESDFIQDNYVKADPSILHFPKEKRNLIYIFLESMESSYADEDTGLEIPGSCIPELKQLAEENLYFSNTDTIGGALSLPGTTWTAAAMTAQTSGMIVKVDLGADAYGKEDTFLPGLVSIGDILKKEGYRQELLLGSYAVFHGREVYFREHGDYEILDVNALKNAGRLEQDYEAWWGFEDQKLFAFAKEELLALAETDQPFNLTLLTADTHFPDGYHCELCKDEFDLPYANTLACSSRQVAAFISWIKEQPFYENTTIIISGDHLSMDADFMENINPDHVRTIYNCFINVPLAPHKTNYRSFGTIDMFPTTLAALGVSIDGERLGLGTNLFSDEPTLCELYGYENFCEELQKQSDFYDQEILEIGK